ncbi:urease accessory protein UreD [Actinomycetospora straminea]|uniref:Urease accessory protein UreD n=1 Tax=Actinomycetospora straminea TaxID=663607 RepID=A0ABP9DT28_9PSEU|nr:urease accessory protein UreD [Actinomycetospora straminea]MDD7935154.1 urease accessory protein UreD [Actinomycetospora straminea]
MRPDTAALPAGGVEARVEAHARLSRHDGRLTWASSPPLVLRRTGPRRVHLVQVGGGPLGGDRLRLDVDLGPGESLVLRTAAATIVQPGRDGGTARFAVHARLGPGAVLDWRPAPTVVTDGADWWASLDLHLADGAAATVTEQLVLGRAGQRGGRARSDLAATVAGRPLLVSSTRLDGADPVLSGPGGSGGARSVGTVLVCGSRAGEAGGEEDDLRWARTVLDGPGTLTTAVGATTAVTRLLAAQCPGGAAGST